MLDQNCIDFLSDKKNLLAFSGGVDSSALFWLLLEADIPFDISIVDYGVREQSKTEVTHAKELATMHSKQIFTTEAPFFENNFEKNARDFRYAFFEQLIDEHHYDHLITAHQLDDLFEWFLMQLSRGSGLGELLGMQNIEQRSTYSIIRPLLLTPRSKLLNYLTKNNKRYFIDESNDDTKFTRNHFRKTFSEPLLQAFENGIQKSMTYLMQDKALFFDSHLLFSQTALFVYTSQNPRLDLYAIDKTLKKLGFLITKAQRDEIEKTGDCVVAGKIAVVFFENLIFIAPYVKILLDKDFKELCRKAKIPAKIRPYLKAENIDPSVVREQLNV